MIIEEILSKTIFYQNFNKINTVTYDIYKNSQNNLESKIYFLENLISDGIYEDALDLYLSHILSLDDFLLFEQYLNEKSSDNVIQRIYNNEIYKLYKTKHFQEYDIEKVFKYVTPDLFFLNLDFILPHIIDKWYKNSDLYYLYYNIALDKLFRDKLEKYEPFNLCYVIEFFIMHKNLKMSLFLFDNSDRDIYKFILENILKYQFYDLALHKFDKIIKLNRYLKNTKYETYKSNIEFILLFITIETYDRIKLILMYQNPFIYELIRKIKNWFIPIDDYILVSSLISEEFDKLFEISESDALKLLERVKNNSVFYQLSKCILLFHGYIKVADFVVQNNEKYLKNMLYIASYTRNMDLLRFLYDKYGKLITWNVIRVSCDEKLIRCYFYGNINRIKVFDYKMLDVILYHSKFADNIINTIVRPMVYPDIYEYYLKSFNIDMSHFKNGYFNVIKMLLDKNLLNQHHKNELLKLYLYDGNYYIIKILIENGAVINNQPDDIDDKYVKNLIEK